MVTKSNATMQTLTVQMLYWQTFSSCIMCCCGLTIKLISSHTMEFGVGARHAVTLGEAECVPVPDLLELAPLQQQQLLSWQQSLEG